MDFISKYLPRSLLARFILIIILPSIIFQTLTVYIFYHRHWDNVVKNTSNLVINNIATIITVMQQHDEQLTRQVAKTLNAKFEKIDGLEIDNLKSVIHTSEFEIFYKALKQRFAKVKLLENQEHLELFINSGSDVIKFSIPFRPLTNFTTYIFVIWLVMLNLLVILISLLFAKNQIKSILHLADAVGRFGQGDKDNSFVPSGSREIRFAGFAFIKMRQRIESQINKHTKMLAMISHDLCTPLTRLRLQLELLDQQEATNHMKQDIGLMQQMINSYLDFARGELVEEAVKIDLSAFILDYCQKHALGDLKISFAKYQKQMYANIYLENFSRVLENIISNSQKYATKLQISLYVEQGMINLDLQDDGCGVSDQDKPMIVKPFYRVDSSRNLNKRGNVGLGLAIVKEILDQHGAVMQILDSKNLGGLMVKILLKVAD